MSDRCSNAAGITYWSCPQCYEDIKGVREGECICPSCEAELILSIDMEPVYTAKVIDEPAEDWS